MSRLETTLGNIRWYTQRKQRARFDRLCKLVADCVQVCVYSNVRFASPPLGKLRFAAPDYPPKSNSPIPGANPSCIQAEELRCIAANPFDEEAPSCFGKYYGTQSEDCLFLDVYVPTQAFQMSGPVPVVVWFYGGAYLFGSKTQYDPNTAPFRPINNKII